MLAGISALSLLALPRRAHAGAKLANVRKSAFTVNEEMTSLKDISTYNNFYEFGTDKTDPSENAHTLKTRPWTVAVEGEVKKPKVFDIEELLKLAPLEERVYRMRCVEGWSMVIPWVGYPLSELIKRVEPTGKAKFVEFITLNDPVQMPGVRYEVLEWPYTEGLRMDEAMHPLSILCVGLYGEALPNQNGAPVRIVVPVEVRVQGRQIHRQDPLHRAAAQDHLEHGPAERVRLLLQRQPAGGPSALEPGEGAAHRRVRQAPDLDVQRLCRPGRFALHRHGSEEELLERGPQRRRDAQRTAAR